MFRDVGMHACIHIHIYVVYTHDVRSKLNDGGECIKIHVYCIVLYALYIARGCGISCNWCNQRLCKLPFIAAEHFMSIVLL